MAYKFERLEVWQIIKLQAFRNSLKSNVAREEPADYQVDSDTPF